MQSGNTYLEGSPFSLLASKESAACWAGRPEAKKRIQRICDTYAKRKDSSLDLIWANLGAGKTHALYHVIYLLQQERPNHVEPIYLEIPHSIRSFVDIYVNVIRGVSDDRLRQWLKNAATQNVDLNLVRTGNVFKYGTTDDQALAMEWLKGGRPHLNQLKRTLGIDSRIETEDYAVRILTNLITISAYQDIRLVLLLDEFQRLGKVSDRVRDRIISGLRTVFSGSPTHLAAILAISARVEKTAFDLLPGELKTLMGVRPSIPLPDFDNNEAKEFVKERLACFRPEEYSGDAWEPFGETLIDNIIRFVDDNTSEPLIPRTILQALGMVFDEFEEQILIKGEVPSRPELDEFLTTLRWG